MKTKNICNMCITELEAELRIAKVANNNPKIQKIYRRLKKEKQEVERCLETWPKATNFKVAMNIVASEGKAKPVIKDGRIVHEIDMAHVILKLFDMVQETANFKAHTMSEIINKYEPLLLQEEEDTTELDYAEYRDGNY